MVQTQTISKRSVEIVGFSSNFHLLIGTHTVECAHVVQTVGEFYEQRSHIILYRFENLLIIVNLFRTLVVIFFLLCYYPHKKRHIVAKSTAYILNRVVGIFYDIVKKCCHDGICAQFKFFSNNACYGNRVEDIWFARFAKLFGVCFTRKVKCFFDAKHIFWFNATLYGVKHFGYILLNYSVVILFHKSNI